MFVITAGKGFQITFENKLTISIQFGKPNYCENYMKEVEFGNVKSSNAEIAIWDENKEWVDFGDDEVKGYILANEVAKYIELTCNAVNFNELQKLINLGI